ncbi:MAG: mannose-6-phosphate isomerase, class I [Treponema sp.]|nr:mannose-6-phosphate isomerase, class I [Treponema sp.]
MAKNNLCIEVLGTSLSISTDEDAKYLDTLLEKYRQAIEDVKRKSGIKDPLKIAVLTGFLLCDDLQKAGPARLSPEDGEAEQLTLGMISRLDELVEEASQKDTEYHVEDNKTPCASVPSCLCENNIGILKLQNTVKNYEWGSAEWIPELLSQRNISRVPWAELWMGVHEAGPSLVSEDDRSPPLLLSKLIGQNPAAFLGQACAENFGKLPFLFKVLAAAKPLSIQAHPSLDQAADGFERENSQGIPLDSPKRNYRDPNHKPEIICALSDFTALCGFRNPDEICFLLEILRDSALDSEELKAGFDMIVSALSSSRSQGENPLKAFLPELFKLSGKALGQFIKAHGPTLEKDFPEYRDEWKLCSYLADACPPTDTGDPGILAPLFLNIVELAPGEAMNLPSGVLHSYIHGLGIELMADSDNVLRGGLTNKHVDPEELLKVLDFSEYKPEIIQAPEKTDAVYSYHSPFKEFVLSVMHGQGSSIPYHKEGPSIVLLTHGETVLSEPAADSGSPMAKGDSIFIPAGKKLIFDGFFTAYAASVPQAAAKS